MKKSAYNFLVYWSQNIMDAEHYDLIDEKEFLCKEWRKQTPKNCKEKNYNNIQTWKIIITKYHKYFDYILFDSLKLK